VSAVIAAFFYLRLVLYMVSSPDVAPAIGDGLEAPDPVDPAAVSGATIVDQESGLEPIGAVATLQVSDTEEEIEGGRSIPLSIATGIAICAGFTVLFGVWPSPIINFAHAATLILH
jgi:NADH:ubiquinone oxidoreductase subunit 2 (subunit N)